MKNRDDRLRDRIRQLRAAGVPDAEAVDRARRDIDGAQQKTGYGRRRTGAPRRRARGG